MTNLHMADPYVFDIWKRPGDKLFFFFLILLETGRHHDTERQTDRQKHTHTHTHTHTHIHTHMEIDSQQIGRGGRVRVPCAGTTG